MSRYKNGVEITITGQLLLELLDEYEYKGQAKVNLKNFLKLSEKNIVEEYARIMEVENEMILNALKKRYKLIKRLAKLDERELILVTDACDKIEALNGDYDNLISEFDIIEK